MKRSRSLIPLIVPTLCAAMLVGCASQAPVDTSSEPQFEEVTTSASADESAAETTEGEGSESEQVTDSPGNSGAVYGEAIPLALREGLLDAEVDDLDFIVGPAQLSDGVWKDEYNAMVAYFHDDWSNGADVDDLDVWWADIDNDGQKELIAQVISTGGGSGSSIAYVVFTESAKQKGVIKPSEDMSTGRGIFTIDDIDGRDLELSWQAMKDDDPMCCPSLEGTGTYRWNGNRLTAVDGPHFEEVA